MASSIRPKRNAARPPPLAQYTSILALPDARANRFERLQHSGILLSKECETFASTARRAFSVLYNLRGNARDRKKRPLSDAVLKAWSEQAQAIQQGRGATKAGHNITLNAIQEHRDVIAEHATPAFLAYIFEGGPTPDDLKINCSDDAEQEVGDSNDDEEDASEEDDYETEVETTPDDSFVTDDASESVVSHAPKRRAISVSEFGTRGFLHFSNQLDAAFTSAREDGATADAIFAKLTGIPDLTIDDIHFKLSTLPKGTPVRPGDNIVALLNGAWESARVLDGPAGLTRLEVAGAVTYVPLDRTAFYKSASNV